MLMQTVVKIALGAAVAAMLLVSQANAQEEEKAPPLPFHSIEGYGGGAITPMAYLVNPGAPGCVFGKPATALTVGNIGDKQLQAITVTETLYDRIELGYGADRASLGDLPSDIQESTDMDMETGSVWLHNFNVRFLMVKEDTCLAGIPLPAVTAGIHFKYNDGIAQINNNLGNVLSTIGYRANNGVDFTLTATKNFAKLVGLPLFLTAGLRESEAAQIGLLGFGNTYHTTFEGNVVCMLSERLAVGCEIRQKFDPYGTIASSEPGEYLVGPEDSWYAVEAGYILNKHTTLCAGWGHFGNMVNSEANNSWLMQLKYEF
jgi:Protein of unknown function (DUF3034)